MDSAVDMCGAMQPAGRNAGSAVAIVRAGACDPCHQYCRLWHLSPGPVTQPQLTVEVSKTPAVARVDRGVEESGVPGRSGHGGRRGRGLSGGVESRAAA